MFVVIVGGGKTGSQLAQSLIDEGYEVKIIESRPDILERIKKELPSDLIVAGDGSSPAVLEAAGIKQASVLAAVTGEDETNLVVTSLGKFEYHVPRVIGKINNPKNAWLFTRDMGVDAALNQATILARLIAEEMSLGDMMTLLKLRKGEFSIVEEKIHSESQAVGKKVSELHMPVDCVLAAIIRQGLMVIPHGDTVLEPEDEILAVVHASQVSQLSQLMGR
ncbi:MAG: TrkA family potassium uptake protein [Anaerolineae bacterium]|nr:TrkA family potassium uptake protein [Anaerolineae bacterium]